VRCPHFLKYLKSGSLFGQKIFIRLGVTPRGCKGDKVNILYAIWFFIFNEVNRLVLQPVFLKYNNVDLYNLKKDKYS